MANVLVAWSGGLDSTALIEWYLSQGHSVNAVYVEILNNAYKSKREFEAIELMLPYFKFNSRFKFLGKTSYTVHNPGALIFSQHQLFLHSLLNYVSTDIHEVAIGFVMGDDAISYLPEITETWNSHKWLFHYNFPKLIFPFAKYSKRTVYDLLPVQLRDKITWCENYETEEDNCGKCIPCQKMKMHGLFDRAAKDNLLKSDVSDEIILIDPE